MRAKLLFPIAALTGAFLSLTACIDGDWGISERFSRDFHYSYPLKSGGRLSLETFNGSVEISGWEQDTVDISGTKYGPSQAAADDLKISIDNSPDSVSIRAVRPSERRNNQGAKFIIKVPRKALLDRIVASNGAIRTLDGVGPARFKTSNGSIRIEGLAGNVDAQTSNASVELVEVDGDAIAHTSNGHIHAERLRGSLDATTSNAGVNANLEKVNRPVHVETSNGGVELSLPADFSSDIRADTSNAGITLRLPGRVNAHVMARTTNSSISSDFEMRVQGEFSKNRMEGTIGSGGPLIDLSTSNGGIRLLRM